MSQQITHEARDAYVTYDTYVEVLASGGCRAQLLDLPGCFAVANDVTAAVSALEGRIPAYYEWLRSHDEDTPIVVGPFHVEVKDTQQVSGQYPYQTNAFFAPDAEPVSGEDLEWLLALLEWSLDDLLHLGERIPAEQRDTPTRAGPPPNVSLHQAAESQTRYLIMLDAQPDPTAAVALADAPPLEQLREVKVVSLRRLSNTSDDDRGRIIEVLGERWSLHKILRCGILSARMSAESLAAAMTQ